MHATQVELKVSAVHLIGDCNQDTCPLQKKKHNLEYLRSIARRMHETELKYFE